MYYGKSNLVSKEKGVVLYIDTVTFKERTKLKSGHSEKEIIKLNLVVCDLLNNYNLFCTIHNSANKLINDQTGMPFVPASDYFYIVPNVNL